jgi:tetratricopeptide (TPR) repeat protein
VSALGSRCYPDRVLRLLVLLTAVAIAAPPIARAQDEWGLTRERGPRRPPRDRARPRVPRDRPARRPPPDAPPDAPPREEPAQRTDVLIERYMRVLESDPRETFAFRRLLDLYRERDGNIERLVADLHARIAADDTAYAPRMLLGHILRAQNRLDEARAAYRRAGELRPREAAPLVALAQIERAQNGAEARRLYELALERTNERVAREEMVREVAQIAMEARDFEGARRYFEELGRGESSVYLRTEYARALTAAHEWDRAIEEYERVIRALSGDNRVLPPVLLELSRAQLEAGNVEASIETLDRALRAAGSQAGIRAEIYHQMSTAYRRTDRLAELAERLRRDGGRGFEASALLGQIEDELGNDEAALVAYRRALSARSSDIDTRVAIINLLTRSGRLDEVVEEYRALIRAAPREPDFVIRLAMLFNETDRRDEALRLLRDAGRRSPSDAALHQRLASLYSSWGEEELYQAEVELLVRIDPNDAGHVIALGSQQFAAGDRDSAMQTWRRVITTEGDRALGHATLGGILADHDLLPQAVEAYGEAVRLEPDSLDYVRGLAGVLERNHDDERAERQWRRALELARDDRPARREARERIVAIWSRTRQLTARLAELEQRFGNDPPDVEAGRFLAEVQRRRGPQHQAEAERVLERVIRAEPGDVESLLALERLRTLRGDLAGAIEVLGWLRDADSRRAAQYLARMAEHALALYRDEEAVEYASEAVQRNPEDATAHRRLADLYRARQDMERAITSYRRALELNDRLYPVYFELAEIHLARGETRDADRLYRQVLGLTPDDDLVARAARASTQIHLGAGTLSELERDLLPLALHNPQRPVFRRMAVELYDAYAGPLVARARRGGEDGELARRELRQIGTRAIKPLLEALADPDPAQRRVALDFLGDLGNTNAAAPLLALAENETLEVGQRVGALLAAGAVAQPVLVPRFVALAEGEDRRLQGIAAWGLARIGGRDAVRAMRRLLHAPDPSVRGFAAIGLGIHGGAAEAGELDRSLRQESDEDVVLAVTWALGRAGDADHVPALVAILDARGGPAAAVAADALGEIGDPRAVEALIRGLFAPDAALRRASAVALRRASSDGPDEAPIELRAPQGFERVRDYVGRLVELRSSEAPVSDLEAWTPLLSAAASAALRGPVEHALAATAVLGAGPATSLALGDLTAGHAEWPEPARGSADRALAALAEALVGDLVVAARHTDAAVRVEAVRVLVRLDFPDARAAIADALAEPPASVQRAALEALAGSGRAPSAETEERLGAMLSSHRDWSMRTRAARALASSPSETAGGALRDALRTDAYAFVREAAAESMARSERAGDVPILERALSSDGEPRVRAAALRALIARGGDVESRARARASGDASPIVRAALR